MDKKTRKLFPAVFLTLCVLALSASVISASSVTLDGLWQEFSFKTVGTPAKGCRPADPEGLLCSAGPVGISEFAGPSPWTFEALPQGATLTVVDAYASGDQFEILDFGVSIGTTSEPSAGASCGNSPNNCLSNPGMSSGAFPLAGGSHSITIVPVYSPFKAGAAFFRVDSNDEPSPSQQIMDLIEMVNILGRAGKLNQGQESALLNKLEKSLEQLNLGQTRPVCGHLQGFVSQVNDFINDGVLSAEDGRPLTDTASNIQKTLGC